MGIKLSEIKTNWEFTKNIGATSYWFEQTDDGTGKTIGPEEVLEIGCQLEADVMRLRAIADDEADRIVALESGISALAERAERVQEGEEWDLPEFILRKRDALLKETP